MKLLDIGGELVSTPIAFFAYKPKLLFLYFVERVYADTIQPSGCLV
jgi:hypothetical protein